MESPEGHTGLSYEMRSIQEASLRERKCPSTPQPLERLPRAAPTTPPFASRPPQPREHPPPRDSLGGLNFDRHSAIFPGAGATALSGPVAERTSDTSGGPRTSLPLDVRRPTPALEAVCTEEGRGVREERGFERRSVEGLSKVGTWAPAADNFAFSSLEEELPLKD